MTLTKRIEDLIARNTDLYNLFSNKEQQINSKLREIAAYKQAGNVSVYVDQTTGRSNGAATVDDPVDNIQAALDRAQHAAVINVNVRNNYRTTQRYNPVFGQFVFVHGTTGAGKTFTRTEANRNKQYPRFEIGFNTNQGDEDQVEVSGFSISGRIFWNISGFDIHLPSWSAVRAAHGRASTKTKAAQTLFSVDTSAGPPAGGFMIRYSNIKVPSDWFGTMISLTAIGGYASMTSTTTTPVFSKSLAGKIHPLIRKGTRRENAAHILMTTFPTL